jgi:hypothetical protein
MAYSGTALASTKRSDLNYTSSQTERLFGTVMASDFVLTGFPRQAGDTHLDTIRHYAICGGMRKIPFL